jgi:chemotaxis protein CheX
MSVSAAARERENYRPLLDQSVREVFEIMLNCEIEEGKPAAIPGVEYTAMVGLAGWLCGVFTLHCSSETAARVAAHMLKLSPETAAEHAWDALGELANVVAGNFKNKIHGASDQCLLSVPSVVAGGDYSVRVLANSEPLRLWYCFGGEPLQVSLELHS